MIKMIIITVVLWIASAVVQGFNLWTIGSMVATALFCGKKIGIFPKLKNLIAIEVITGFITVMIQLLFKRFKLVKFLITVVIRIIFILVAWVDSTMYVYFKETRRKGDDEY